MEVKRSWAKSAFLDAIAQHEAVLFAGAGYSVASPSSLPTFDQFRRDILNAFGAKLVAAFENQEISSSIEILLKARMLPEDFFQILSNSYNVANLNPRDEFTNRFCTTFNQKTFNFNHLVVATLVKQGYLRFIITSNFDTCFENALMSAGWVEGNDFIVYRSYKDYPKCDYQDAFSKKSVHIFKLHGSSDNEESIKITHRHVRSGLHPDIKAALSAILMNRTLIVGGYSGRDVDIYPFLMTQSSLRRVIWIAHPSDDQNWLTAQFDFLNDRSKDSEEKYFLLFDELSTFYKELANELNLNLSSSIPTVKTYSGIAKDLSEIVDDILGFSIYYAIKALALCHLSFGDVNHGIKFLLTGIELLRQASGTSMFSIMTFSDTPNVEEHKLFLSISFKLDLIEIYNAHSMHNQSIQIANECMRQLQKPTVSGPTGSGLTLPLPITSAAVANRLYVRICLGLANAYRLRSDNEMSRNFYEKTLKRIDDEDHDSFFVAYSNLAVIASISNDWEQFLNYCNSARKHAEFCWGTNAFAEISQIMIRSMIQHNLEYDTLEIISECKEKARETLDYKFLSNILMLEIEFHHKSNNKPKVVETANHLISVLENSLSSQIGDTDFAKTLGKVGSNIAMWYNASLGTKIMRMAEQLRTGATASIPRAKSAEPKQQGVNVKSRPYIQVMTGGIKVIHFGNPRIKTSTPDIIEFDDVTLYPPQYPKNTTIFVDESGEIEKIVS